MIKKSLEPLIKPILHANGAKTDGSGVKKIANPITPAISKAQISKFSNVLSVSIVGNHLSLCRIERLAGTGTDGHSNLCNSIVLRNLQLFTFNLKRRMHFVKILNEIKPLVNDIPSCDLCIAEEYPTPANRAQNLSNNSANLEMTYARSMLLACLASRPEPPEIVAIKTVAVARLFSTLVGSERVSGQHLVDDIFESDASLVPNDLLRDFYLNSESRTKEHLSNVFLINLAYWILTNQFNSRVSSLIVENNNTNGN